MAATDTPIAPPAPTAAVQLESGTYEIIRKRLESHAGDLRGRLDRLNAARKGVFGSIETKLIANNRIVTEHNCIPQDMIPVGRLFIFGYNVHLGLKSEIDLSDVFSVFSFDKGDHSFHQQAPDLIRNAELEGQLKELYKYYKLTTFTKFAIIGPHLFMVFRIGKGVRDIKTFKWLIKGDGLHYLDNRSDHEFRFPPQTEFEWKRTRRDYQRKGKHPHISVEDRIFVETVGGDLTIKVEDNTDTGEGIFSEKVEHAEQSLDDAEFYYAGLGNLILLKVRPYQEKDYRYIVFNDKLKKALRIDAIGEACVLLPDGQGLLFPNGYYLQSGGVKQFDNLPGGMQFEKTIPSPNGEDVLYVFHNLESGTYVLMPYNLIEQKVENPVLCNGFSLFGNGELCYFRSQQEPGKNHLIQVWQTPFVGSDYVPPVSTDNYLYKVGNKDIVRAMAEAHDVINLVNREDVYASLYSDLVKKTGAMQDAYYWLKSEEAFNLNAALAEIRTAASSAIEEFEKVVRVRRNTQAQTDAVVGRVKALVGGIKKTQFDQVDKFVQALAALRGLRGEVISLKDLRYADLAIVAVQEEVLEAQTRQLSADTVTFLLSPDSLTYYRRQVEARQASIAGIAKVADGVKLEAELDGTGKELDLLIEIVSNLKIDDSTQTTAIIDGISAIYAGLNGAKATLKSRKRELLGTEAQAEFAAQLKLIGQGVVNYLDVCDTPARCDEYLTKLMVQLEELEGRFAEFDEFITLLAGKREEIYGAFEGKKQSLTDARNKRAQSLLAAADRILKGIGNRVAAFKTVSEINGYFAGDLMIGKVRDIVAQLTAMEDPVKADEIESRLKTVREDAVRQLKDRQDLFVDGQNVIRLGKHAFSVNTQPLDLTILTRDGEMYYHLTGTNFYEPLTHPDLLTSRDLWGQELVSENGDVYRAEYLAYCIYRQAAAAPGPANDALPAGGKPMPGDNPCVSQLAGLPGDALLAYVQAFMAPRYAEGYVKGVHDHDAALILKALLDLDGQIDLLRFAAPARACAALCWQAFLPADRKALLHHQLKGIGVIRKVFPHTRDFGNVSADLRGELDGFIAGTKLFDAALAGPAAEYLFEELTRGDAFIISPEAAALYEAFGESLRAQGHEGTFRQSLAQLEAAPPERYELARNWVRAFVGGGIAKIADALDYADETAALLFLGGFDGGRVVPAATRRTVTGLLGTHPVIRDNACALPFNAFLARLSRFAVGTVPRYLQLGERKKSLAEALRKELRLEEFTPRVLTSFVRNKLIDGLYLPLIGDNLAKQIGVVGADKRTDLMGMLLLISPPGYGKTTLMEYVANRLGLIFMKINGPAIGHRVTSLDPAEAPNAGAREEVHKLNLAFEMGDNVMIYVDDIQHCNPEFLQKFISLCDGQRRIEGVYKGKPKTYDLRGKKVCVVMAGNPYTESGEKFRIPDMLANRADTYNLGDIIGDTESIFKLSYVENCLTANPALNKLITRSQKDIYTLIKLAETGNGDGLEFETGYAAEELNEYVAVLKKLFVVRDFILRNNLQYIHSAAQADEFRTEPPFKLQGSYRNMNKIAGKVVAIMNEAELHATIISHYENEAQTLTTGTEANLLKFKELNGLLTEAESTRWAEIKTTFRKNQQFKSLASGDQMGQLMVQLSTLGDGLHAIREVIAEGIRMNGIKG